MDYVFWGVWAVLLLMLFALSSFLEKKAALRGSHRTPMPAWVDKGIRVFFLVLIMWPFTALLGLTVTGVLFLLYLPSYLDGSEKRGRDSGWLKKDGLLGFVFKFVYDYFDTSYESEDDYVLEKNKSYVAGIHPHAILPVASMVNVLSDVSTMHNKFFGQTKIRCLAASFCFLTPLYRDLLVGGGIIDAARYNAQAALESDKMCLCLVPGGATEALYCKPGSSDIYIKKRKGFVKLAIETGSDLVPIYSFGESETYGQLSGVFPWVSKIQRKFQAVFGISLPMLTNILPRKVKITCVAAKPIPVVKKENPSDAEVQEYLDKYIAALERVYYKYAPKYIANPAERKLNIH